MNDTDDYNMTGQSVNFFTFLEPGVILVINKVVKTLHSQMQFVCVL